MSWLLEHAEIVTTLAGCGIATWVLIAKIDKAYLSHLREEFATKSDFHRLETKIDHILFGSSPHAKRRRSKSSAKSAP